MLKPAQSVSSPHCPAGLDGLAKLSLAHLQPPLILLKGSLQQVKACKYNFHNLPFKKLLKIWLFISHCKNLSTLCLCDLIYLKNRFLRFFSGKSTPLNQAPLITWSPPGVRVRQVLMYVLYTCNIFLIL